MQLPERLKRHFAKSKSDVFRPPGILQFMFMYLPNVCFVSQCIHWFFPTQLDFFLDQLYSIYYLLPVLLSRQVIKAHTCRLAMWKVCLVGWNNLVSGLLSPGIPIYCCYGSFPCLCTIDVNYHETVIVYIKLPCLSIL